MSAIRESLIELERTVRAARVASAAHLRPGIEASTTAQLLDQVGLVPSAEVVEWFGWHNGAGDPDANIRTCELAPGVYIFDLETLCQEYLDSRRDFDAVTKDLTDQWSDSSDLWSPSWFPLARLDAGYLAVDLAGGRVGTSPVHAGWFDASAESKTRPQWPTLDEFVREVARRYERGTYEVDPNGYVTGPDVDAGLRAD